MCFQKRFTAIIVIAAGLSSLLRAQSIPPSKPLTAEIQIRLVLQKIEQGIKEQSVLKVTDGFADEVESSGIRLNRKALANKFKTSFENSQSRKNDPLFIKKKPPKTSLTTTWDFEMELDTIQFINDSAALAKTWIYYIASEPDTSASEWKFGKKHRINFMFRKVKGEWRVKKLGMLLKSFEKNEEW